MADYTFSQLEALWKQAGGPAVVAPIAAAIALAESGGNPGALNTTDNNGTQTSVGLWQVSNGTHEYPSSWLTPAGNAKEAVAKYNGAGDTFKPWGTYDSGAYLNYLPGGASSAGATASSSTGGSSGTQQAQLDVFNPGSVAQDLTDPFDLIQASAQAAGNAIASLIRDPASLATSVATFAKDFNALASVANTLVTDMLWLFKPSSWVRIACFGFGIMFLLPGVWMLSRAGQGQGDISLALGILLIMVAGVLLFLAFHNLPEDVKNLSDLLGYLSSEIRSSSPATTG